MKHLVLICLTAASTMGVAFSQGREDGKEVRVTPWRKQQGSFAVMLTLSSDPDGFMQAWKTPEYKPKFDAPSTVKPGEKIAGFLLISDCKAGKEGRCDVTADLLVTRPDRSTYAEKKGVEVWKGKPVPGVLQLSEANLTMKVEPDDPLGIYLMTAAVRDNVAEVTLNLEKRFMVLEAAPSPK